MKILIIKPSSFGDIVQAAPSASALKQIYPDCEIDWIVFKQWKEIPELFEDIDKTIIWERDKGIKGFFSVLSEVRKKEYNLIIDLQGLLRSALLARAAKGKVKIGVPGMKEFSNLIIKEAYPKNAQMNATLRNLEPVRYISNQTVEPKVKINVNNLNSVGAKKILDEKNIKNRYIALLPFARGKGKDWSIDNYNKLINIFKEQYEDIDILILGSVKDKGKILSEKATDLCGYTGIKELAYILSKAEAAIGADTGPMHLAAILNTPSIFIFGESDINETAPYLGRFSLLINQEDPKDINKVDYKKVFEEIKKWIK